MIIFFLLTETRLPEANAKIPVKLFKSLSNSQSGHKSPPMTKINSCGKRPYQKKTYITPMSYRDINSQFVVINGRTSVFFDE